MKVHRLAPRSTARSRLIPVCAAVMLCCASLAAQAASSCVDEDNFDTAATPRATLPAPVNPRVQLAQMVQDALTRSKAVGASRLLAEAAQQDIEETRAGKSVQASVSAGIGPALSQSGSVTDSSAAQAHASLTISQLLYDGGRTDRLVDWRTQIAESVRQGNLSQQEQIAVSTVSLALERSRYRMQVQVYGQYVRKMSCLVEALETIVRSDRGRASELVQARKSKQQAELSMADAQSQVRQVEVRLRRFVGDGLPVGEGLSSVLLTVPPLDVLQNDVLRSADLAQLDAQASASREYAAAVAAGGKPQVSWSVGGAKTMGAGGSTPNDLNRSGSLSVGVQVNIPLINPGVSYASNAALKRAEAAELQRADALEARRYRVAEVYEQTEAAFDRARRTGAVLRDSDLVRNYTLQQWQQLGRRSLFDVMAAEGEHYSLRVAYVNAIHDGQELNAVLLSLGRGVSEWLR
jgi:outer membrane protein TolC